MSSEALGPGPRVFATQPPSTPTDPSPSPHTPRNPPARYSHTPAPARVICAQVYPRYGRSPSAADRAHRYFRRGGRLPPAHLFFSRSFLSRVPAAQKYCSPHRINIPLMSPPQLYTYEAYTTRDRSCRPIRRKKNPKNRFLRDESTTFAPRKLNEKFRETVRLSGSTRILYNIIISC